MHQAAIPDGLMLGASETEALRRRLQHQELVLRGVQGRFRRARETVAGPEDGVDWRGPAQVAYSLALGRLRGELAAADEQIDGALRQTRLALASLESRVG